MNECWELGAGCSCCSCCPSVGVSQRAGQSALVISASHQSGPPLAGCYQVERVCDPRQRSCHAPAPAPAPALLSLHLHRRRPCSSLRFARPGPLLPASHIVRTHPDCTIAIALLLQSLQLPLAPTPTLCRRRHHHHHHHHHHHQPTAPPTDMAATPPGALLGILRRGRR